MPRLLLTLAIPGALGLLVLASQLQHSTPAPAAQTSSAPATGSDQPSTFADLPAIPGDGTWKDTPSGLKYLDLAVGQGPSPRVGQRIALLYAIRLENGKLLASSRMNLRDEQVEMLTYVFGFAPFPAGWTEAISTMKVGGWRRFVVPPGLAYGNSPLGGLIPRASTLIIDAQLLYLAPQILSKDSYR